MMPGRGENPIFFNIKKIKIGGPEHSVTPHPPRPITSHFFLTSTHSPIPPQSGRHICITPNLIWYFEILTMQFISLQILENLFDQSYS